MFSFTDVVGPGIKKCVYFADTGINTPPEEFASVKIDNVDVVLPESGVVWGLLMGGLLIIGGDSEWLSSGMRRSEVCPPG